tara:strand:+ start:2536 stop:3159 length:624 start_codon:yes stop_codon:yes gene_type:complete
MELDKDRFFKDHNFNELSSDAEFQDFILNLSNTNKPLLTGFIKNVLTLRILEISERENGLWDLPKHMEVPFLKVFKKRHLVRTLNRISDEMGIFFPSAIMSNTSIAASVFSIVGWLLAILFFLYSNIALLFSGIEILLIPFYLILAVAPYLLLTTLFPAFFALGHIKGVRTLSDFIERAFKMNFKKIIEDDYSLVVRELTLIQESLR